MEKILDIVDALAHQKGLEAESVRSVLKNAYINTAKRILGDAFEFDAELDEQMRNYRLYQKIAVVEADDERLEDEELKNTVISLDEARELDAAAEVGDELNEEITLEGFGRTAAMVLHQELERELQRLTEDVVYENYKSKVGKLISGVVTRVDSEENTYIEMGEVRAVLPKKNRIKGERFRVGETVQTIVKRVHMSVRDGIKIELSRTTPRFLEELLSLEVPEISDGSIIIEGCARIPGERAKVALTSLKPHVDPVGATVGTKGVRINAVSAELHNESIDVINHSPVPEIYTSRAMSPAIVNNVICQPADEKSDDPRPKAIVTIGSDQKAKAIGKSGINIRLASMLTGHEIELEEVESGSESTLDEESKGGDISALNALFGS